MSVYGTVVWVCRELLRPVAAIQELIFSKAASAPPSRHGRASRRVFNPELTIPTRSTVSTLATGPRLGVTSLTVDLNVIQVATWATDRAVTLELLQMDETGFNVNYDATYTLPDLPDPPIGWQTYSFPVDANSPTIPQGWVFTHGDGTPGTDAEWSPFLHRVDLTSIGFYKPGFAYPSLGTWILGIDNIEIDFQPDQSPTPTPTPIATPSATPRSTPFARPRPTPAPRPTL